jgi:chaperonin GroES
MYNVNESGYVPVGRAVLIKPYEPEKMSSIIEIPESLKSRTTMLEQKATVVEVGPSCWHDEPHARAAAGDHVIVTKFAGYTLAGEDGQVYRLVNDRDIFAKVVSHG